MHKQSEINDSYPNGSLVQRVTVNNLMNARYHQRAKWLVGFSVS